MLPSDGPDAGGLHGLALIGDLVSNLLYYAAIPARTPAANWARAIALGTAAGLGALLLPERVGLGKPPHADSLANQLMTVKWYLAGAVTTAVVATWTSERRR